MSPYTILWAFVILIPEGLSFGFLKFPGDRVSGFCSLYVFYAQQGLQTLEDGYINEITERNREVLDGLQLFRKMPPRQKVRITMFRTTTPLSLMLGVAQILHMPPDSRNGIGLGFNDKQPVLARDDIMAGGPGMFERKMAKSADFGTGAGLISIDGNLARAIPGEYGSGPTSVTKQPVRAASGEFGSGTTKDASTHVVPLSADPEANKGEDLEVTVAATLDLGRTEAATS